MASLVDWAIVIVLVLAVMIGIAEGFFRSAFFLGGLFAGMVLAAWNYARVAALILPLVRIEAVAFTIGFLLIALLVMGVAGWIGSIFSSALHHIGLGCLDRLAGAVFGLFQGALLVVLCIMVTLAFFPQAHLLARARLPRLFLGACHLSMHMSPAELAERVRLGLKTLEKESPHWLHPASGGV